IGGGTPQGSPLVPGGSWWQMKSMWIGARLMVVPGGSPLMIMWTWVGLRYSHPSGGSEAVLLFVLVTTHGSATALIPTNIVATSQAAVRTARFIKGLLMDSSACSSTVLPRT